MEKKKPENKELNQSDFKKIKKELLIYLQKDLSNFSHGEKTFRYIGRKLPKMLQLFSESFLPKLQHWFEPENAEDAFTVTVKVEISAPWMKKELGKKNLRILRAQN